MNYVSNSIVKSGIKWRPEKKNNYIFEQSFWANINDVLNTKKQPELIDVLHFQLCSLIAELASAAASDKGLTFEEAMEDRLCAYSRAVAHFPTAVKEVSSSKIFNS